MLTAQAFPRESQRALTQGLLNLSAAQHKQQLQGLARCSVMWKAAGRAQGYAGSVVVCPSWHTRPVELLCWEELELEPLGTAVEQNLTGSISSTAGPASAS